MTTQNIIILIISILTILLGVLVLFKNYKNKSNIWYFLMCLSGGAWGVTKAIQLSVLDIYWHEALISRLVMFFGSLVPLAFLILTYYFIYKIKKIPKIISFLVVLVGVGLAFLHLFDILRHTDVFIINNTLNREIVFGDFLIFTVYFFIYVFLGLIILFKKYFSLEGVSKTQVLYLMIGTVTTFLIIGFVSVILLLFNNFDYDWLGAIFLALHLLIIGYFIFIKLNK